MPLITEIITDSITGIIIDLHSVGSSHQILKD